MVGGQWMAFEKVLASDGSIVLLHVPRPLSGPLSSTPSCSAPTWSQARKAVFGACEDHPMEGCATCTAAGCPDPLASLSEICHEMPDMAACGIFWSFCDAAKREDVREWCAEDDSK